MSVKYDSVFLSAIEKIKRRNICRYTSKRRCHWTRVREINVLEITSLRVCKLYLQRSIRLRFTSYIVLTSSPVSTLV